jgi:D-alanyl-D-alanine carboxypeptidase/D-alanyl-D-alanine-endopeptidase (penicillin-binding protein 4)
LTVLVLVALLAAPAAAPRAASGLRPRLDRAVAQARAHEGLAHALIAVEVRSLATGRTLYSRDAETSLAPASCLKLATTAAALDAFGADRRFRTTVETTAADNAFGRVLGDIYLMGSGDPSLSRELEARPEGGVFEILADALLAAGVRRIEGKLVGVDGLFAGERRGADWTWEDLVWWYGAEVASLTFADGAAHVKVTPGAAPGDPVVIERHPSSDYYRVDSKAITCRDVDPPGLVLERPFGANVIQLSGCLPLGSASIERWVALEDPARYATTVFAQVLRAKGIEVTGGVTMAAAAPAGRHALASYDGAPLGEILKDVNKPSHNLRAEMLLRLLGVQAKNEGTVEAGRDAVLAFLAAHDVDTKGWEIDDGSGMSRSDLVTASGLAALLVAMDKHPQAAVFRDSLPVAGVDGTLKRRLTGPRTRGRVQAKTGTLRHTCALAGYAAPVRGEGMAFTVLVDHATAPVGEIHDAIDAIAEALFGR